MSDRELMVALVLAATAGGRPEPVQMAAMVFETMCRNGLTNDDGSFTGLA